jgi:ACS family hexuronate transporter-like MFS transporter
MSRWTPAIAMLAVSLISYIDRNTLAILAPTILRETGLSAEQYGYVIAAFSIAYMIANPVWGRILDRAGLRRGMLSAVACWTAASVAHAFAGGLWSFAAARAALGFGEGATFPGGLRTVVQTLPKEKRGRGLAVAYSGGSLGAVVAPWIVTPVFHWFGWRAAFWFTGLIGAAWVAVWSAVSRRPDVRKIPPRSATAGGPRWRDRAVWAFISAYALGAVPLGFVLYGAPLYLAKPLGCSQEFIGKVLWIPPLGWEVGYFFWGWLADRRRGSLGMLILSCTLLSLPFGAIPSISGVLPALLLMFAAMFAASGFVVLSVSYANYTYSSDHAGLIAGLGAGSWSAVIALTMPLFGRLFDLSQYPAAFRLAAVFPLAGLAGWAAFSRESVPKGERCCLN